MKINANDESIEFFKKVRDVSGEIAGAYEKESEGELESAMGKFIFLMMQADAI